MFVLSFGMIYYQSINVKWVEVSVTKLNKMSAGVFALVLAVGASMIAQVFSSTYAANTLVGNNEIITIGGTTDDQPVNASTSVRGYSADGNIIVFSSEATNLPNAGGRGLYVFNIRANTTARVDISTEGAIADRPSNYVQVSETGRYITFTSNSTTLVDLGLTNKWDNIYLRDTQAGITTRVGYGNSTSGSPNYERNLGISNDGRFRLAASRYINATYPYSYRIVLIDYSGTTTTLGVGTENEGSQSSTAVRGALSCDGSFVIFQKQHGVYFADLRNKTSPAITELTANGSSPLVSCNGRYMLYTSLASTALITPTPTGLSSNRHHLVRYDRITGERIYVNSNSSGVFTQGFQINTGSEPYENAYTASIADTGDVVFKYNNNVYLKHLSDGSGTLEPIAKTASGNYLDRQGGTITRDGKYIFFDADPYDLGLSDAPTQSRLIRTKTNL